MTRDARHAGAAAVYRCFDARGRLLYVGCTKDWEQRALGHRTRPWWPLVAHTDLTWFVDRAEAEECEAEAIRTERPLYNVNGRDLDRSTWTREDYEAEITARRAYFDPGAAMHKSAIKLARLELELALRFPAAAS